MYSEFLETVKIKSMSIQDSLKCKIHIRKYIKNNKKQ